MAEINLRVYVSEIEDLVEHNQLDEAVAHCRHILSIYPKHLDCYRLLGKALLEQGRHSDAADIFQRVHSVAPDDFVSHVGMAIIREDETNLDGAIWHMERAFEVQSSNAIIHEELRRLYGRRDGLQPAKIQYTRGALARTYARGGLYAQAIAELQAALAEEPDRLDLRALYGEVLWRNNQRPEAAEASTAVLEKLPFCRQANLVMADILQAAGQSDQAQFYRTRVEAVDPYEAFVQMPADMDDVNSVPDHAVRVPKFQWSPAGEGERAGAGPEWMSALGIKLQQPAPAGDVPDWLAEPVEAPAEPPAAEPDNWLADLAADAAPPSEPADTGWLRALRAEAAQAEPPPPPPEPPTADWMGARERAAASPTVPAPSSSPDLVPDWLRELESLESNAAPATIVPGEPLPDWLRPEEPTSPNLPEAEAATPSAEAGLPDWLTSQPPQAEAAPLAASTPAADLPDWMLPEAAEEEARSEAQPAPALPDWLRVSDLQPPAEPAAESPAEWAAAAPSASADLDDSPEWDQPISAAASESLPDWLAAARPAEAAGFRQPEPAPELEPPPAPANVPSWLQEAFAAATPPEAEAEEPPAWPGPEPAGEDLPPASLARADIPDWIKALAPEADEAELPTPETVEGQGADLPPYLQEHEPGASDTIAGWLLQKPPQPPPASTDEVPAWLQEALSAPPPATPENKWLADLAGQQPSPPDAPPADRPAPFVGDTGPLGPGGPAPFEAPEPPAELEAAALPGFDRFAGGGDEPGETRIGVEDETLAWLESLAAKHGGQEEEPPAPPPQPEPEVSAKDMPDWLRTALAKRATEAGEANEAIELPEAAAETAAAEPAAEALPGWLAPPEQAEPAKPAEPVSLSADPTEAEALAWLEALASRHTGEPAERALTAPQAEIYSMEGAGSLAPADSETAALGGDEDEALAWLEALASKHGVQEEPAPAPAPAEPEQSPAAAPLPDWLMATRLLKSEPEAPATQPAAQAEEPAESTAPAEAPAWPGDLWTGEPGEAEEELPEALPAESLPDWLREAAPTGQMPGLSVPEPAEEADEALAWLESLAAKHGVPEEELTLPAEARRDEMPDWLKESQEPEPSLDAAPDWLKPTGMITSDDQAQVASEAAAPPEMPIAPEPEAAPAEALPDWLAGPAVEPPEAAEPAVPATPPDWLAAHPVAVEPDAGAESAEPEQAADLEADAALAWLEALAAKHGAKEEELVMPAEARTDKMPAWLREAAPEPVADEPQAALSQTPAEVEPEAPAPIPPDTLAAEPPTETPLAEAAPEPAAEEPAPLADDDSLAWLEALAAKHGAKEEELVMPAEARTDEMPAWLRESLAEEAADVPAMPAAPEPVMPAREPVASWETPAEAAPGIGEEDELPAWLREAMAEPTAQELGFVTPAPTAEPLPDWLSQRQPAAEAAAEAALASDAWPEEFWPPASADEARVMQTAPPPPAAVAARPEPARAEPERAPKAARPARQRQGPAEPVETQLVNARAWLQAGQTDEALGAYNRLLKSNRHLNTVVADLEAAASAGTLDKRLLRTLGDAYMRQDRLQQALDIYRQALGG